jgi:hypothetical protein
MLVAVPPQQTIWRTPHRYPPLQKTQGWGTLFENDAQKFLKVGHPPHSLIFVLVLGYLSWLYYLVAVPLELFFFYASASFLFGLKPPGRR